ncbi:hypothetical protein ACDX78_06620 [Virgibacillus oceani]
MIEGTSNTEESDKESEKSQFNHKKISKIMENGSVTIKAFIENFQQKLKYI